MELRNKIKSILQNSFKNNTNISDIDIEDVADKIRQELNEVKLIPFLNCNTHELELVDINEVLYVQLPKPKSKYLVYTEDKIFEQITKGYGIEPLFFNSDNFVIVDSKAIVNINKVKKYDSDKCRLFFSEKIDENSHSIQVFQKVISEFSIVLGKHNDVSEAQSYTIPKGFTKKLFNT